MTREEQIKQAAEAFARSIHSIRPELNADSFRQGAEWADSHPSGSVIRWQTGDPTEEGEYLVQLSWPVKTAFEIDEWLGTHDGWSTFATSRIIAWCPLSEIKPYKEDQP